MGDTQDTQSANFFQDGMGLAGPAGNRDDLHLAVAEIVALPDEQIWQLLAFIRSLYIGDPTRINW